jgi:peptidoglycan/xylan/chitin deacetylase (PgdA/CDA1 family)
MLIRKLFLEHKFLPVFAAIVIITFVMIGLANLSTQSNPPTQSSAATMENTEPLASTTPSPAPLATPLSTWTAVPAHWEPLSPIPGVARVLFTNGDRAENKVALTFDVCQAEGDLAGYDSEIIRVLNETQTPATFFLGGEWMRDHQANTLELARNPLFELGNHSWSHRDFSVISADEMKNEILLAQQQMYDLLGYQTNLFRLPYGTYNEEALNVIGENGLYAIQWDDVSGDPDPNIDAQRMTNGVLQYLQSGSIIIMHANGRGWHTAEALPGIIQSIRQQGYTLVTVSDLLQIQPYK